MGATVEKVTLAYSVITEFDSLTSSISVPGGAHQLVQHRAHLGLRRHGGGVAGGRGWGAERALSGGGDKGKGWGELRRLSLSPLPRDVRKGSRRGCRRVRAAAPHDDAYVEVSSPRKRPSFPLFPSVPGTEAIPAKQADRKSVV